MTTVEQRYDTFRKTRFFGSLDGLRALSIFLVIWHHVGGHRGGVVGKGYLGVSLFFAISGFLITTLLLRERDATGDISLKGFYVRRTLRIFPLYYAVIGLYTGLVLFVEKGSPAGQGFLANLPWYLSYTSNWFVGLDAGERVIFYFAWSLATEEQFYLVWPSLVKHLKAFYAPAAAMTGIMLGDLALELAVAQGAVDPNRLWVHIATSVATPICLGCLGAYLLQTRNGFTRAWPLLGQSWCAPASLSAVVLSIVLPAPGVVVFTAMAWLVLAVCVREDHPLKDMLANAPIRYVGTISYGMYLLHMLALNAARNLLPGRPDAVTFVVGAAVAVALASVSHRFFERPFLKLKDKLGRPAVQPAVAVM